jgi:hypothetical protein
VNLDVLIKINLQNIDLDDQKNHFQVLLLNRKNIELIEKIYEMIYIQIFLLINLLEKEKNLNINFFINIEKI